MEKDIILTIEDQILYYTGNRQIRVNEPLEIHRGVTVLTGPNGSGKSTFARILENGRNFRTNRIISPSGKYPIIRLIEFNDIHSLAGLKVEYYQQRYEAAMNDEVPFIADIFGDKIKRREFVQFQVAFHLEGIENKKINFLSSGELRKLLIINAMLELPDLLVLDNPYIGLDRESIVTLNEALAELKNKGHSFILIIPDSEIPPVFTDNIVYADALTISDKKIETNPCEYREFGFSVREANKEEDVCVLSDCEVKYGSQTILENFNWTVRQGERWSLSGPNGSGKSTLLSLLNADNPKAYCNNIKLFGKKRGSGESIWDVKKRIGYVSPEMQLHFHATGTVVDIIANGLNDTVGMYVKPTEDQKRKAEKWLRHFNLERLGHSRFDDLSSGEKQLVLIARSFIKEPELLILDEPMHALDSQNLNKVKMTLREFLSANKSVAFIMVTHRPDNLPEEITRHLKLEKRL